MSETLAAVWVPVNDMKRAVHFYGEVLGLEIQKQGDQWSEATSSGLMIGLNGYEEASRSSAGGGAVITFYPDGSIEEERERLAERGADIEGEISDLPWGRFLPFKDSEGNDLQLFTPKD